MNHPSGSWAGEGGVGQCPLQVTLEGQPGGRFEAKRRKGKLLASLTGRQAGQANTKSQAWQHCAMRDRVTSHHKVLKMLSWGLRTDLEKNKVKNLRTIEDSLWAMLGGPSCKWEKKGACIYLNLATNCPGLMLICPLYRWGNWGLRACLLLLASRLDNYTNQTGLPPGFPCLPPNPFTTMFIHSFVYSTNTYLALLCARDCARHGGIYQWTKQTKTLLS